MNLLLDVNIVLDICTQRQPHAQASTDALGQAIAAQHKLWLYAGSVQTLEYTLSQTLHRNAQESGQPEQHRALVLRARQLLKSFSQDKHWLAALAGEGPVFDTPDPEDAQLIRALQRFAPGTAKLLTRDEPLLDRHPDLTISPHQYLLQATVPTTQKLDFIDLAAQQDQLRPQLETRLHRVLHHGQYIMGPEVRELEERLEAWIGAKHCITVASGTEALLISLMALGIRPGDEVITTPFTFVATAEVIVLLGAKPVFVDIQPDTCNIDPALIEAAITPRTRAIMPVSLYGQPADMDEINAIAAKHGLPVIEDACQSFGASYKDKKSCNLSTIGCTSFFPSKPLGCYGDGGAIFTGDDALAKAMREIRVHGQERRYYHTRIGVGGRMDTLQCAILLAKLDRFDWEIERRMELGTRYTKLITDHCKLPTDNCQLPTVHSDRTSVYAQYTVFVDNRDAVARQLNEQGIPTAVHYPVPLHRQPAYQTNDSGLAHSERVASRVLSLPMGPDLAMTDQDRIIAVLREGVA